MARSLDTLLSSISDAKLDREIDFEHRDARGQVIPQHLGKIAASMVDWQGAIADHLGLSEADRSDIRGKNPREPAQQRREALGVWKSRLGSGATYRALIEVFFKAGRLDCADAVCDILKDVTSAKATTLANGSKSNKPASAQEPTETSKAEMEGHGTSASISTPPSKLDELPTLDDLLLLKYKDSKGKQQRVRIINEASHKWKDIANLICSDVNVTVVLEGKCHADPNECLKQAFINYFISKKPQRYTQDWSGLIELLEDVELETFAEKVKEALSFCN